MCIWSVLLQPARLVVSSHCLFALMCLAAFVLSDAKKLEKHAKTHAAAATLLVESATAAAAAAAAAGGSSAATPTPTQD